MPAKHPGGRPAGGPLTSLFSSATLPAIVATLDRLGTQSIDDLAGHVGVSRVSVSREVRKLTELGIVTVESVGKRRLITLADTPAARAVHALAALACDVPYAIAAEFAGLEGVERVAIYGSWAARNAGEHGRLPQDIDVLVIGSADRDDVFEAADRATTRLGIPVSAKRVTAQAWRDAEDPFLQAIRQRPLLEVHR